MILPICYFSYNFYIVGSMVRDALDTSFAESGCTVLRVVMALFLSLPLHVGTIFCAWILPLCFPDKFRVGGERISDL